MICVTNMQTKKNWINYITKYNILSGVLQKKKKNK